MLYAICDMLCYMLYIIYCFILTEIYVCYLKTYFYTKILNEKIAQNTIL